MGNVCQGGAGQAPARQATLFAGDAKLTALYLTVLYHSTKMLDGITHIII